MLNSSALDVAVGMIFTFLALSLVVSSIVEGIASLLKWRSGTLLKGVKDLLNDKQFSGLTMKLYNHALINPREPGKHTTVNTPNIFSKRPAYINSDQFANALIDIIGLGSDPNGMKAAVNKLGSLVSKQNDPQLNQLLNGIIDRSGGDLRKVQQQIATWFDNSMDRVGGAYKRRTQLCTLIIALIIAAGVNVSAVKIGRTFWRQPILARAIGPQSLANADAAKVIDTLEVLHVPVGWTDDDVRDFRSYGWPCIALIGGWLMAAVATLFGAPFWFDALQQIIRLKGSGPSPDEKQQRTAAEA